MQFTYTLYLFIRNISKSTDFLQLTPEILKSTEPKLKIADNRFSFFYSLRKRKKRLAYPAMSPDNILRSMNQVFLLRERDVRNFG